MALLSGEGCCAAASSLGGVSTASLSLSSGVSDWLEDDVAPGDGVEAADGDALGVCVPSPLGEGCDVSFGEGLPAGV